MTEALALLLVYLAVVLVYAASRRRRQARLGLLQPPTRAWTARLLAVAGTFAALRLWQRIETGPAAWLVVLVALMLFLTLVTLLGPLRPRLLWGSALAALAALPVLALLGAIP